MHRAKCLMLATSAVALFLTDVHQVSAADQQGLGNLMNAVQGLARQLPQSGTADQPRGQSVATPSIPDAPPPPADDAVTPETQACDDLAGNPWDSQKKSKGVEMNDMIVGEAIKACTVAVSAHPNNPRLQFELARSYFAAKQYDKSSKIALDSAPFQYAANYNLIGLHYHFGLGAGKNIQQAAAWYAKAAEMGSPQAQYQLGVLYYTEQMGVRAGVGTPSKVTAFNLMSKAAESGFPEAQRFLGFEFYYKGNAVEKDYAKAFSLISAAAQAGNAEAQNTVAYLYQMGEGTSKDIQQAISWYRRSADQGNTTAQLNLAHQYQRGEGVPQDSNQAIAWMKKAADGGNEKARNELAAMQRELEQEKEFGNKPTKDLSDLYGMYIDMQTCKKYYGISKGDLESAKVTIKKAETALVASGANADMAWKAASQNGGGMLHSTEWMSLTTGKTLDDHYSVRACGESFSLFNLTAMKFTGEFPSGVAAPKKDF